MLSKCPADGPGEWRAAGQWLGRLAVDSITDDVEGYHFELGKGILLREGGDVASSKW